MEPSTDRDRSFFRAHDVIREFTRSASSAAGEDPATLVSLLRHTLPAHFAYEERPGGFFDQLLEGGVSTALVGRLKEEHGTFLAALDRLEGFLERREPVAASLWALAETLREHEWIESVTAVRAQLWTPADVLRDPGPARQSVPEHISVGLDTLADDIVDHATRDPEAGLLSAVVIDVPRGASTEIVSAVLEDLLSERGIDFVDIAAHAADGPLALRETRFEHVL